MIDLDAYLARLQAQPDLAEVLAPLFALIEQQAQRIRDLDDGVTTLRDEVATLKARLAQDSTNRHKPPASDGHAKAPAILRPKGGRRGGKLAHPGRTLLQVAYPDAVDHARPDACTGCGASLAGVAPEHTLRRRVLDLPEPRLVVEEDRRASAPLPEHVPAPVRYGAGVPTLATLLHNDYHVPVAKVSRLFGHRLNEATIEAASRRTANRRTAAAVARTTVAIDVRLVQTAVVHADETGLRAAGRLHWLHVLGFCSTARKQGRSVLAELRRALEEPDSLLVPFPT